VNNIGKNKEHLFKFGTGFGAIFREYFNSFNKFFAYYDNENVCLEKYKIENSFFKIK
jgi:hypothetical protein